MADDEGNGFWGRVIAAAFLIGAGGALVAAYSYGVDKYLADDGYAEEVEQQPNRRPGAPTRIEVSKLHDAMRRQLGNNSRGLPRVTLVEYDDWPDRLAIVFPLEVNHPATQPGEAKRARLHPLRDVLRHAHAGGLSWSWVLVSGTAPTRGYFGGAAESTAVRAVFSRKVLDDLDWSKVTDESLAALAEQFVADPDLGEVPGVASTPPQRRMDFGDTQPSQVDDVEADAVNLDPQLSKKSK